MIKVDDMCFIKKHKKHKKNLCFLCFLCFSEYLKILIRKHKFHKKHLTNQITAADKSIPKKFKNQNLKLSII